MSERNKEAVRRVFEEVFNGQRLDLIPELYTEDCVGRDPANQEVIRGYESLSKLVEGYRAAFPEHRYQVEAIIAERDMVCVRWTVHDWERNPGEELIVEGLSLCQLKDGRICEAWQHWDNLGFLKKLEAVDSNINVADTVAKFIE